MIPREWRSGEVAVVGLGKSGRSVSLLLARDGLCVYASDSSTAADALRNAAELCRAGVAAATGGHDLDRIARAALVVASPGVPPDAPPLLRARQAGVTVVSEIEVALRYLRGTGVVAVTGTNGKTTTTALAAHLLRALGRRAAEAGNIGTPLSDVAFAAERPEWIALEVSSFQLHDTPGIDPAVGVITNLAADHLDRYATVEEYFADKRLLFRNASERSRWVVNGDDAAVLGLIKGAAGARYEFSLGDSAADAVFDRATDQLVLLGAPLLPRSELSLLGDHNVANALAAALAVSVADRSHATAEARRRIAAGLRSFRALEHRLEVAGEYGGVLWINDSKATNVGSTLVAVAGMTRPTVLLLGGRHKGEPYTALAEPLARVGRAVIAYGEAGPIVARDLAGVVQLEQLGSSFGEVVARAREIARPGDAVLLSPACSSFDMFKNFEERGAVFKRLAAEP